MSSIEVITGDYAPGIVRLRFSTAGRPFLRLREVGGDSVGLWLASDVAGIAEARDPGIRSYVALWLHRDGLGSLEDLERDGGHGGRAGQRIFVLVTRDRRKFIGRATTNALRELIGFCGFAGGDRAQGDIDPPRDRIALGARSGAARRFGAGAPDPAQQLLGLKADPRPRRGLVARLMDRWT